LKQNQKDLIGVSLLNIVKGEITRSRHPQARRLPTFYPSSASVKLADGSVEGGCWTADYYRIKGVKPTNPPEFYISMIHRLGKAVENTIVEAAMQAGIYESNAVKFYDPKINVSGELDITCRYRKNQEIRYFGVEVKSVYGQGAVETISGRSRAWRGQAAFRPRPKLSNLLQTMVYLHQFSKEKGDQFYLEGFKLLYVPRDKPNDGREYTVFLVTKADLSGELLDTYGPEMVEGEHYAFVSTPDHPDYVETSFSLENMYRRWTEEKGYIDRDEMPPRPFKKFYSDEEVEALYQKGDISDSAYEDWKKKKARPGHYLCQSYCEFRDFCYSKQGTPRKEADSLATFVKETLREKKDTPSNG